MTGKTAFLGLGAMGFGMATNLVKFGFPVTGFDVWAPTLQRFAAAGGLSASTPREAVRGAQYIVFMVATAAQANEALFGGENAAIHEVEKGAVVMLCSTGPPGYVVEIRKLLDEKYDRKDVEVVDAPVSGGTLRAAAGTLTILSSGPESALSAGAPILNAMAGPNLYTIPGGLGAGTNVKMVHQVLAGIHITLASEAMGFAAALGLNTKDAFEALSKSEGVSWMFDNRVPHMIEDDPKIYSALNIIVKDVGIITTHSRLTKFPLFLTSATEQVLLTGISAGYGPEDDSRLTKVYLPSTPDLVLKLATSPSITSDEGYKLKLQLVINVMKAVHLASAAEAMSLGMKAGLELNTMFEIIGTAAGSSAMFLNRIPGLLSGKWSTEKTIDEVIAELSASIQEANRIKYPLHLAATALQLFQLVALRGSGKEPDLAVSRIWDGPDGPLFPRAN
ncbi:NAD binding domain of 6-phosphogluconate dehydrogenase-domain-containing protein [Bisporella sp. PMI_857]|nr:NAD binding domain of 6-phosphogluconate dehydrogenase-domain-containing protein [Bisporella sp. PMI_857]